MNSHLESFIADAKAIAQRNGLEWDVELGPGGIALPRRGWNLTNAAGASPPPVHWLNDFGMDARAVEVLNSSPPPGPVRTYVKEPLSCHWQDLIKACAVDQLLIRRNTSGHVVGNVARPLRVLATCASHVEPWAITVDEVNLAVAIARRIQASGKLADLILGVVRSILDPNHLTDAGPLFPALARDKKVHARAAKFAKSLDEIRENLEERKQAEKLPEKRAFWELVRIVFTETPKSFLDLLRFAQARTLILTGLRDGECVLLPADWKRFREYFDLQGNQAGQSGGISRSLMLRHFAEKQRIVFEDSNVLYETVQHVPLMFQEILSQTLDRIAVATEPLRKTLRAQVETGRALPQFAPSQLIRAVELYTYLSGNPFFIRMSDEDRQRYVTKYQRDYDPAVLDELRQEQLEALWYPCTLDMAVYQFLRRFKGAPYRDVRGIIWDGTENVWSQMYLRVGELEDFLAAELPTKRSDTTAIKLATGELGAWELLFLMPKRALAEGLGAGLCDVTRYSAIGRMDRQMMSNTLSSDDKPTLFAQYGQSDQDRELKLRPHALRHLQNTELFRLGIADTIITKRFNRRQVAQSYDYDHRSLAEELDKIDLKPEVESRLGEKSATVARLIKAGKATGQIVKAFRTIQKDKGEDAALEYLRAEADGFHSTPYGHCINSFMVDPCPTHLECFNGCCHLTATGLTENRNNLVQLEARLQVAVDAIQARKQSIAGGAALSLPETTPDQAGDLQLSTSAIQQRVTSIGLDNQLTHATTRLANVRKLLAAEPGQVVFPDGQDLSTGSKQGTVLDDIL